MLLYSSYFFDSIIIIFINKTQREMIYNNIDEKIHSIISMIQFHTEERCDRDRERERERERERGVIIVME